MVPAMAVMGGIIGKIMTAAAKDEMDIYGKVAEIFPYGTLRTGDVEDSDVEDTTLRTCDFEDTRI